MVPKATSQLIIRHLSGHQRHQLLIMATLILIMLMLLVTAPARAIRDESVSDQFAVALNLPEGEVTLSPQAPQASWKELTVQSGDTLTSLLQRAGLDQATAYQLSHARKGRKLRLLKPGQVMRLQIDEQEVTPRLVGLDYPIDREQVLSMRLDEDNSFFPIIHKPQYEHRIRYASGVVQSSLYEAALAAQLTDNMTMQLAEIFGWDIDFAQDIRQGDHFSLIFDEKFLRGEKVGDGEILAAEFTSQGKTYRVIRFVDEKGRSHYYDEKGRSVRKAFLRTPVDFRRISSRFGSRYHPILKKMKRHTGVDYAARPGTPIRATGDGKIIFRGRKGGYGKVIIIQHGNVYSTLYAHMRAYARGMRPGRYIRQGQIIGFVGQTGRATGPHLHYEFRVHGVHRNPLTVRLPDARPIKRRYRQEFQQLVEARDNQLALFKARQLAMLSAAP